MPINHANADAERDEAAERRDGWMAPARGIAIGAALGLIAWVVVGWIVWLVVA